MTIAICIVGICALVLIAVSVHGSSDNAYCGDETRDVVVLLIASFLLVFTLFILALVK